MNKSVAPSEETIRALAHKYWEEEGRPEGRAEAHWLRAIAEFQIPALKIANSSEVTAKPVAKKKTKR